MHFWKQNCPTGWGHCLVFETDASDPGMHLQDLLDNGQQYIAFKIADDHEDEQPCHMTFYDILWRSSLLLRVCSLSCRCTKTGM